MRFHSTRNREDLLSPKDAVLKGLCNDGGLFVEPVEGSRELSSADRIRVSLGDTDPVPAAGDRIEVVYNGVIQESYPAGLGEVYSIRVVARGEETRRTKPPALTVQWGRASVEALLGAYSWQYANGDGTWSSVEADSLHPLQAKAYMTPLYLSSESKMFPMTMAVYQFYGRNKSYWNYIFADIVLTCIPVIIVYLIGQRYIIGGMTSGAVKE